jgi:hypothetical protein
LLETRQLGDDALYFFHKLCSARAQIRGGLG